MALCLSSLEHPRIFEPNVLLTEYGVSNLVPQTRQSGGGEYRYCIVSLLVLLHTCVHIHSLGPLGSQVIHYNGNILIVVAAGDSECALVLRRVA